MYPVPDGPLFPLKAQVAWSIEPGVNGISIDAVGNITVAADVPHGTTAIVHADIERGRRKLLEKMLVYRAEENLLIGEWRLDTRVICGESHEIKKAPASSFLYRELSWKFHVNQQFWVGKEHNIAGGVHLAGTYDLDLKDSKIKLMPTSPQKPIWHWSYLLALELSFKGWRQDVDPAPVGASGRSGVRMRLHPCTLKNVGKKMI